MNFVSETRVIPNLHNSLFIRQSCRLSLTPLTLTQTVTLTQTGDLFTVCEIGETKLPEPVALLTQVPGGRLKY